MTRKSFGLMMRKLSVTESQKSAQFPGNLFTQKTERRIGELGASCVALVVSDVSADGPHNRLIGFKRGQYVGMKCSLMRRPGRANHSCTSLA